MLFSPIFLLLFSTLSGTSTTVSCDFITDSNVSLTQYIHSSASVDEVSIETVFNYNFVFSGNITVNQNGLYSIYYDTLTVDFTQYYCVPNNSIEYKPSTVFTLNLDFYYYPGQESGLYFDFVTSVGGYDSLNSQEIVFTFPYGTTDIDYELYQETSSNFYTIGDNEFYYFSNYTISDTEFADDSFTTWYKFNILPSDSVIDSLTSVLTSSNSYNQGYNDGYLVGFDSGENVGYSNGYNQGYNDGFNVDNTVFTIFNGILNVALVPINFFLNIFNFEILGINLKSLISALLTVAVIIIVVRIVTGKKE